MRANPFTIEQILAILTGTIPRIRALTTDLSPAALRAAPDPGEWSISEILAHLRACNEVWGSNIKTILAEDKPTWKGVNPRAWIKKTDYLEQVFQPALQAFTVERQGLLAVLEPLPPESWSRSATVFDMIGRSAERTVLGYADGMARHERSHLRQIERIANRMRK